MSFRASEELDGFLEKEAERRMTTKSTVAQMLVAERVRQLQLGDVEEGEIVQADGPEEVGAMGEENGGGEGGGLPAIFERYSDRWHVPDSSKGNKFAVKRADDRLMYYKTVDGAAERLRQEYVD